MKRSLLFDFVVWAKIATKNSSKYSVNENILLSNSKFSPTMYLSPFKDLKVLIFNNVRRTNDHFCRSKEFLGICRAINLFP